jgi:hypothetical protein
MVGHEHPCVDAPPGHFAGLGQGFEEKPPVIVIAVNGLTAIPPGHDVIKGAGDFDADASGHGSFLSPCPFPVTNDCLTPSFPTTTTVQNNRQNPARAWLVEGFQGRFEGFADWVDHFEHRNAVQNKRQRIL